MQTVTELVGDDIRRMTLPPPEAEVLPGVQWGLFYEIPTPAFWAAQAWMSPEATFGIMNCGGLLAEEVGFCLLGGYGVTAELNRAAYRHLREAGVFKPGRLPRASDIERLLIEPLKVGERLVRYRYPRQRAGRLSIALQALADTPPSEQDHHAFRQYLMRLPGIGPKTASWITRNWLSSNDVAILDIHVIRACQLMGVFPADAKLPRDYDALEQRFLAFADGLDVHPSLLDVVIWREMRHLTRVKLLKY